RCVCGKKIGPDPRNFNQRVSLGRNDLLIRTFLNITLRLLRNKIGYLLVGKNFRGCVFNNGW
ncbi:MAG: hypothetical protein E7F31_25285, partial [Klebsiella pneumoniae]|nr:hypothetical protein [Klebsiella pneumoniae]MDU3474492.1 hypothetical protein [Klebsiella pneumoniae]